MAFLSEILGHTITDIDGRYIGKLEDLIAREPADAVHPIVDAVVIKDKNKTIILPYSLVMALFAPSIPLKCHAEDITLHQPTEDDIFLSRDVLDKQIIDTNGARVVRVNDLELVRVNGTMYVGNVDIGMLAILRRLGVERSFICRIHRHLSPGTMWSCCATIPSCACAYLLKKSRNYTLPMSQRSLVT
jgi:sporulation protein YlmC with PRC-barrel domain